MNTLIAVVSVIAAIWLAFYAFGTLSNSYIGFLGIGLSLISLTWLVDGLQTDLSHSRKITNRDEEE